MTEWSDFPMFIFMLFKITSSITVMSSLPKRIIAKSMSQISHINKVHTKDVNDRNFKNFPGFKYDSYIRATASCIINESLRNIENQPGWVWESGQG